jgi:four helix bundle protein
MKNNETQSSELPIFIAWLDFLKWLLNATEKFPKKARFTFSDRINNLALDVVESLVEARYSKNKKEHLRKININIEKVRILMRISFESRFISHEGYKHFSVSINEIGKMLGGWIKQQDSIR